MKGYPLTSIVAQVGSINFTGNVMPPSWFEHLRKDTGKPDAIAAIILSEIVYWYRPIEARDEATGKPLPLRNKFKRDLLQRTYDSFADQFGFSKNQVKYAFETLKRVGVVKLEFRTVDEGPTKLGNVMFIELVPSVLAAITNDQEVPPMQKFLHSYGEISEELSRNNSIAMAKNPHTLQRLHRDYTERENPPPTNEEEEIDVEANRRSVVSEEIATKSPPVEKSEDLTIRNGQDAPGFYCGMPDPRQRKKQYGGYAVAQAVAELNLQLDADQRTPLAEAFAEAYGWTGLVSEKNFSENEDKLRKCHAWAIQAFNMGIEEPERILKAWQHWQTHSWQGQKGAIYPEGTQLIEHISKHIQAKKAEAEKKSEAPKEIRIPQTIGFQFGKSTEELVNQRKKESVNE